MKKAARATARPAAVDELGAHVSTAGGVANAPERAAQLRAVVLQLFTKQPNRWAERAVTPEIAAAFRAARAAHGIRSAASHDSYLINLATADHALYSLSYRSFRAELERCVALGLEFLVAHPGNATDGNAARGLAQNAAAIEQALEEVPGTTAVLLETTAGGGTVIGASFKQLAELRERIGARNRARVGICLDTCHVWVAGYDLREDYEGVVRRFDDVVGLEQLRFFHLNDSQAPRGSRRDRHAHIGAGTLGSSVFRTLLRDERLQHVPKVIETPKDDDAVRADRRNLKRLRSFRAARR